MKNTKELREWGRKRQEVLEKKNDLLHEVKANITGLLKTMTSYLRTSKLKH